MICPAGIEMVLRKGESFVALCVVLIFSSMMVPIWSHMRTTQGLKQSASNLRQLAVATQLYAEDHDGQLPAATSYFADLKPYGARDTHNPASPVPNQSYGVNLSLAWGDQSLNLSAVTATHPVLLICDAAEVAQPRDRLRESLFPHGVLSATTTVGGPANREPWSGSWVTHPLASPTARKIPLALNEGKVDAVALDGHLMRVNPTELAHPQEGSLWDTQ